jgi:flagellar hook-basal body complex protein FliE
MINGIDNLRISSPAAGGLNPARAGGVGGTGSGSFADVLQKSIGEVTKLQQDASQSVEDLATGKTEDITGVMTAMEKSDLAFKTLLAIRAKLMEAYEEIKNISV